MNEHLARLAREAGFVFWADGDHRPKVSHIDWSAQYDQEFQAFAQALVRETVRLVEEGTDALAHYGIQHETLESVELDLSEQEFADYARRAHEQGITFNRLVEHALRDLILRHDEAAACE